MRNEKAGFEGYEEEPDLKHRVILRRGGEKDE